MSDELNEAAAAIVKAHVPFAGLVSDLFGIFIPDNDANFRLALEQDLLGDVLTLKNRVACLEAILAALGLSTERHTPTDSIHILRTFAKGRTEAFGEKKREAVVNATAWQFDPRLATKAVRKHWLDIVADLSNEELLATDLLANRASVMVVAELGTVHWSETGKWGDDTTQEVTALEAAPIVVGLARLERRGFIAAGPRIVSGRSKDGNWTAKPFVKRDTFETLVKFISEPRDESPADVAPDADAGTPPT